MGAEHGRVSIPRNELTTLAMSIAEAHDLAQCGELVNGCRCLQGGLARAREAEEDQEPWGADLVKEWEREIERYCQEYGVSL